MTAARAGRTYLFCVRFSGFDGGEVVFADEGVDAFGVVDDLGDFEVGGGAEVGERGGAGEVVVEAEVVDGVADGFLHGFVEVGIEADGDPVVGGFGEWGGDAAERRGSRAGRT